jgi:hypothetical protein
MNLRTLAALFSLLASTALYAQSPHFIKGPTATLDPTTGDYCVSFKEAGLGNTPVTYQLSVGNEVFTFRCFTRKGNTPQGSPNSFSFSNDSVQTTITPHNGQITASLCIDPQRGGAGCQGGGLVLKLIHVLYGDVSFCDLTNQICFDEPTIDQDVGPISFGGGHGH